MAKPKTDISSLLSVIASLNIHSQRVKGRVIGLGLSRLLNVINHPVVKKATNIMKAGVFTPSLELSPQNNYEEHPEFEQIDKDIIPFITDQLNNLKTESWSNILKSIFVDAFNFGWSISQPLWKVKKGRWVLDDIQVKPPYNFTFFYPITADGLDYIYHYPSGKQLQPDRLIIGTWPELKHNNWYGESEWLSIVHDIELLEKLEELRANGIAKVMVRVVIHYSDDVSRSEEDFQGANIAVEQIESNAIVQLPMRMIPGEKPGSYEHYDTLKVLDNLASEEAFEDIGKVLDQIEKRVDRIVGISDDMGFSTAKFGSQSKADRTFNFFTSRVEDGEEWVIAVANRQIVNEIIKWNYSNLPAEYKNPGWVFQQFEGEVSLSSMQADNIAITNKIIDADEPFLRTKHKYPPKPVEDVEESDASAA